MSRRPLFVCPGLPPGCQPRLFPDHLLTNDLASPTNRVIPQFVEAGRKELEDSDAGDPEVFFVSADPGAGADGCDPLGKTMAV